MPDRSVLITYRRVCNFSSPCQAGGEEAVAGIEAGEGAQVVVRGLFGKKPVGGAWVKGAIAFQGFDLFSPWLQMKVLLLL